LPVRPSPGMGITAVIGIDDFAWIRMLDLARESFIGLRPRGAADFELACHLRRVDRRNRNGESERDRVAEIDPATFKVVRSFPTGFRTWGIGLSPDEKRLYAASGLDGTLTIIDLERNRVARKVELGGKPWGAIAVTR